MGVLPGSEGGPSMPRPQLPGPAAFAPRGYGGYTMRPSRPPGPYMGGGGRPRGPPRNEPQEGEGADDFDGKRPRKSVMRKTVDYNSSFMGMVERRIWQRDARDKRALQADVLHYPALLPPVDAPENPTNAVTTKFVKTATNKMRCPVFTLDWTPEGRRLITGASSGEFTLWNGLTFNFETILQAHDTAVQAMKWSHNDTWMITGDRSGYIKYWQSNMNNVKMFQAHKEAVRRVSFSPTDAKFASCSDDGTVRVWDFFSCVEERVLRGHGSDVKCVDWHPTKGILASGSKDNQQPVKLWEPKTGTVLTTLHAHKSTVMDIKWNANGNWLLTASRDHLLKIFDIRNTKEEMQTFRGHKKEVATAAWHPVHEGIFASGGSDGSIMFWSVGADKEVGAIEAAHESIVWALSWHPAGHILCSGSNDHNCKFWTRNRPGDSMRDKYNLNTMLPGTERDVDDIAGGNRDGMESEGVMIPGMAPEDRVEVIPGVSHTTDFSRVPPPSHVSVPPPQIPPPSHRGPPPEHFNQQDQDQKNKKTPYSKPIPKNFQNSWNDIGSAPPMLHNNMGPPGGAGMPPPPGGPGGPMGQDGPPGPPNFGPQGGPLPPGCISLQELQRQATAVVAFGNVYPVLPGANLFMSIMNGEIAVKECLRNEFIMH